MISMSALRKSFEAMGFPHVSTYINSGNIIFTTKENDARKLEKKIEQMLSKEYQLDSRVVLRSLREMEKLVQSLPRTWTGDPNWRYNVIFLRHTIDSEKILDELVVKDDIEEVLYSPGALLWSAQKCDLTRTQIVKLSSRKMYQDMTIKSQHHAEALRADEESC